MMKSYVICTFALLMSVGIAQSKSTDATDAIEAPKHAAPTFTADSANIPAKDVATNEPRIEVKISDTETRRPIGMGSKPRSSGLSIEDYVMVPVENLEAQLNQNGPRSGHPTGKLKGKYHTLYSGPGAASGEGADGSDGGDDGDAFESDEDDDEIRGDDSDDDDGNGSTPQKINI